MIRDGALVAFPTETVYGLGADATNDRAVAAIFEAKGRPRINPLIVHCAAAAHAREHAIFDERASSVAEVFWPGPLTLVLSRQPQSGVSLLATAGLDTIAVRVPSHPVARDLLRRSQRPIAAPSANRSGEVSPTTPVHVAESLGSAVPLILAGGRSEVGLESTVLDLTADVPLLLRPGAVTREDIEGLIGPVATSVGDADNPSAPGQLLRHYAPSLPMRLNAFDAVEGEALLTFGPDRFIGRSAAAKLNLSEAGDLHEAAANLFAMIRTVDRPEHAGIAVVPIPDIGLGVAINDRLRRAAHRE